LPRVKKRRLLVAACAAFALLLACMTGELRGAGVVDDESGDVVTATDSFEALPAPGVVLPAPPSLGGAVYVVLQFPPSRMTTADVFRPPQA
jgi:hypothetical protein